MKRLLLIMSALFVCTLAIADDITINWGVDNQPYTTTTCEVGGDVVLPSVSKRGHTFKGWKKLYNRGTFSNWASVPTDPELYSNNQNNNSNKIPQTNDYIIVSNMSDYVGGSEKVVITNLFTENAWNIQLGITGKYESTITASGNSGLWTFGEEFTIEYRNTDWYITFLKPISVKGVIYEAGKQYSRTRRQSGVIVSAQFIDQTTYSGAWRLVYDGVWEVDGKSGWKPVEQIISE